MAGLLIMATSFRLLIHDAVQAGLILNGIANFIGCMVGYVLLACYITISLAYRLSNRIAGPIYRIQKGMEQLKNGEYCEVKLRKGDYLPEVADAFNELVEHVRVMNRVTDPDLRLKQDMEQCHGEMACTECRGSGDVNPQQEEAEPEVVEASKS